MRFAYARPRQNREIQRILGVDPGFAAMGLAVLANCDGAGRARVLHHETLRTATGPSDLARLEVLGARLWALARESRADLPAAEALASLLQREQVHPLPRRTRALAAAAQEARDLYQAAAERWAHAA